MTRAHGHDVGDKLFRILAGGAIDDAALRVVAVGFARLGHAHQQRHPAPAPHGFPCGREPRKSAANHTSTSVCSGIFKTQSYRVVLRSTHLNIALLGFFQQLRSPSPV